MQFLEVGDHAFHDLLNYVRHGDLLLPGTDSETMEVRRPGRQRVDWLKKQSALASLAVHDHLERNMTTPVAAGVLVGNIDRFNGINVPAKSLPDNDHDFAKSLSGTSFILESQRWRSGCEQLQWRTNLR